MALMLGSTGWKHSGRPPVNPSSKKGSKFRSTSDTPVGEYCPQIGRNMSLSCVKRRTVFSEKRGRGRKCVVFEKKKLKNTNAAFSHDLKIRVFF
jgi:hypothetical protein